MYDLAGLHIFDPHRDVELRSVEQLNGGVLDLSWLPFELSLTLE